MYGNSVRSAFHKFFQITHRFRNHQMHVKKHMTGISNGLNYRHTEGYTRNKHSVHHINMQLIRTGLFHRCDLFP